jgi:hypothetical protein
MSNRHSQQSRLIEFFPADDNVAQFIPDPQPMSEALPEWWRKHEVHGGGLKTIAGGSVNATVKKCPAVLDALTTGYLLRVPIDIFVDTTGDRIRWQTPKGNPSWKTVQIHSGLQVSGMPFDRKRFCEDIFKIHPLWSFNVPRGYSILSHHPAYFTGAPWQMLPAVMDADDYSPDGAYSMLIEKGFKGVIAQGTPLVQIVPINREDWSMVINRKFDEKKIFPQKFRMRSVFQDGYRNHFWKRKSYR